MSLWIINKIMIMKTKKMHWSRWLFLIRKAFHLRYGEKGDQHWCKTSWKAMLRDLPPTSNLCCIRESGYRPFPSSKKSHFQNEAKCKAIDMKMIFNYYANKTHFHNKGFALSLVLKVRFFGTRKWPIEFAVACIATWRTNPKGRLWASVGRLA